MKVFAYVVAASKNPDAVECVVPYKVNNVIFFGPCKKRLRENLYKRYLKNKNKGEVVVTSEDIHIIGINKSNSQKVRKIIWIGKMQKILTFEKAYKTLSLDKQFRKMMSLLNSPLHINPIYDKSEIFIGYNLRSKLH